MTFSHLKSLYYTAHHFWLVNAPLLDLADLSSQVDRLDDELLNEKEKYKGITEELEQTFAEMSGY